MRAVGWGPDNPNIRKFFKFESYIILTVYLKKKKKEKNLLIESAARSWSNYKIREASSLSP